MTAAILNGFGRTLGDGVIGLQALFAAQAMGAFGRPVLFRLPGLSPMIEALYAAADFAEIAELPWEDATPGRPFSGAAGFSPVIDIRDFAFDPAFRGVAMIDYFLGHLGVAPGLVPAGLKRNIWLAPRVRPEPSSSGYVMVCPRSASRLRDMPDPVHAHILFWLRGRGVRVLSQVELPPSETLGELCGLVAGARLVVSTDTAMVHLADAFAVPCLAFFPTHRPEWRVRDYPLCRAVCLPASVPPALEFARSAADIAATEAAWFPQGRDFNWLERALQAAWDAS